MKFNDAANTRIYCKEYDRPDGRRIVMLQNDKQIRDRIATYGEYEYEFN